MSKQKIKFYLVLTVAFIFLLFTKQTSRAQANFDETMFYLDEKFQDLDGLSRKFNDQYTFYITDINFGLYAPDKKRITFRFKRVFSDNTSDVIQIIFNPKHIVNIEKLSEAAENGFHYAKVTLSGNLALKVLVQSTNKETSENNFTIPFIAGDPKAFNRLKAALDNLKLISLIRDSQDPFAN